MARYLCTKEDYTVTRFEDENWIFPLLKGGNCTIIDTQENMYSIAYKEDKPTWVQIEVEDELMEDVPEEDYDED